MLFFGLFMQNRYFFERDIEELSSIHNDSDYDSYTLDNYEFKNIIKFMIINLILIEIQFTII